MTTAYLLDTNLLVGAFDTELGNAQHEAAKVRLEELLTTDARLAITPLIRYEVLRGVKRIAAADLSLALDGFIELEITRDDAVLAARIYAQARINGSPLNEKKRAFDVFHCVTAHRHQLEIASQDGDIPKIMNLLKQGAVQ